MAGQFLAWRGNAEMLNLIDTQPTRGSRGLAEQVYQPEQSPRQYI